jgi:hypothetical protein
LIYCPDAKIYCPDAKIYCPDAKIYCPDAFRATLLEPFYDPPSTI